MLVLTYRSDDLHRGHPLRPFLAELDRLGGIKWIELAGIGRRELAQLLAAILGQVAPPALVGEIMTRSDGNPFFAEELLAAHVRHVDLSTALHELVVTRVHALSVPAQQMLETAAVAGRRVDHDLLAAVTGLPAHELIGLLREAVDDHVLVVERDVTADVYAFRHSLVQQAIYDDLLTAQRHPLHADYARAMTQRIEERGGGAAASPVELGQLAYHWRAAGRLGEALLTYVQAGLCAEATIAYAEAQQYYERAVELWEQAPDVVERSPLDRGALLERAAHAAYRVGEAESAVTLARRALTEVHKPDSLRTGALLGRLALYHWAATDSTRAMATIEQAVATIPVDPPTRERAGVLASHARLLMLFGRNTQACQRSEEAIAVARLVGARAEEGQALNTLGAAYSNLGHNAAATGYYEQAGTIAEKIGDPEELCRVYNNLAMTLTGLGRSADALTTRLDGARLARRFGLMRTSGAHMLGVAAESLLWLGRWEEADQLFDEVFDLDLPAVELVDALLSRANRSLCHGDLDAVRTDLAQITAGSVSTPDPRSEAARYLLLAELAIAEGRLADARAAVLDGRAVMASSIDPQLVVELCVVGLAAEAETAEHARAVRAAAEHEDAALRAATLLEQAKTAVSAEGIVTTPYMVAAIATAEAEWSRTTGPSDPGRWNDAGNAWDQLEVPYRAVCARWRQAEALLAKGASRADVEAVARAAWRVASRLGARRLTDELESLARRGRLRLDNPLISATLSDEQQPDASAQFQLTTRERQVLTMLADGRTNKQIAKTLYISEKTAGVHVSHILAKLGVTNRGEAAAIAHRLGLNTVS
jgi:DNA-binding CsgD family transcriptional regulator/tetratricopeptide (TPR) repeat protein